MDENNILLKQADSCIKDAYRRLSVLPDNISAIDDEAEINDPAFEGVGRLLDAAISYVDQLIKETKVNVLGN